MRRLPQRLGKQGSHLRQRLPLIRMMIREGVLCVLFKVRDVFKKEGKKSLTSSQVHINRNECIFFFFIAVMCSLVYDTLGSIKRGWTSQCVCVWECECTSIEEMLDFTGVISATSVNYSCVLIVWLELTRTTSSSELTRRPRQRAYRQQLFSSLIITC